MPYKLVGGARVVLITKTAKRARANMALHAIGVTKMVTQHPTILYYQRSKKLIVTKD